MSIQIQKQIKDNSTEVNEYFQDLLRWEEEEVKREGRRERRKTGAVNGTGASVPPPRGQAVVANSGGQHAEAETKKEALSVESQEPIARDKQSMPKYYHSWEQFDADAEADKLDEIALEEQRKEREARQAEKDRIADSLAFNQQTGDRQRTSGARPLVKVRVKAGGRRASPVDLATPKKEEANRYFAEGRFREAIAAYSIALEYLEKYQPAEESAAQSAAEGGGVDEEACALKVTLFSNRAAAHLKVEEWRSAADDATEALRFDASNEKAVLRRGMALAKMKKWAAAAKDLERAVAADPSYKKASAELQMVRRMLTGQLKEGRVHAQAVMCDPTREMTMPTRRLVVSLKGRGQSSSATSVSASASSATAQPNLSGLDNIDDARIGMSASASEAAPKKYVPRSVRLREAIEQRKAAATKPTGAVASTKAAARPEPTAATAAESATEPEAVAVTAAATAAPKAPAVSSQASVVVPKAAAKPADSSAAETTASAVVPKASAVELPPEAPNLEPLATAVSAKDPAAQPKAAAAPSDVDLLGLD
mmetsp:Transcript_50360/g.93134  ORF Transcript_50360/g.93134 Transcript_50360/m.93134 type:complete len:539 (+) Transcript_50360:93-1709(+)